MHLCSPVRQDGPSQIFCRRRGAKVDDCMDLFFLRFCFHNVSGLVFLWFLLMNPVAGVLVRANGVFGNVCHGGTVLLARELEHQC